MLIRRVSGPARDGNVSMNPGVVGDNEELRTIFDADQADRRGGDLTGDPQAQVARDSTRRSRVQRLLDSGAATTAADYFHAAMVFQHGGSLAAFRRAHLLANRARDLGHPVGAWLAAASFDRWLTTLGRPQHFGTQFQSAADGTWILLPIDPATTDDERAAWGVPSLAESVERARTMSATAPPAAGVNRAPADPVVVIVSRDQLAAARPVEFRVAWRDDPMTIPFGGLESLADGGVVMLRMDGAAEDNGDLWVRILVADAEDLNLSL